MKNESAKRFAEKLSAASGEERRRLWSSYGAWIQEGAKAQGACQFGYLLVAVGVVIPGVFLAAGQASLPLFAPCGIIAAFGAWIVSRGFRRETKWRKRNPWREPTE